MWTGPHIVNMERNLFYFLEGENYNVTLGSNIYVSTTQNTTREITLKLIWEKIPKYSKDQKDWCNHFKA